MVRILGHLRQALWKAFTHDILTTAKATAYSGILLLFPGLLLVTSLLTLTPGAATLRGEIRSAFDEVLPADTMMLVQTYFQIQHHRSVQVLWSASTISFFAAMGVMLSLMEGFRRAYQFKRGSWKFWKQRLIAGLLIPSCLIPLALATLLIVFGHQIENWMIDNADHEFRTYVLVAWRLVRWAIALATCVTVLTVIYHFGTPHPAHWRWVLPGASLATVFWFLATLVFGWYVTRFADYSVVYGSLGAGIATLVWLYITSLSVLIGAEFNAQICPSPAAGTTEMK